MLIKKELFKEKENLNGNKTIRTERANLFSYR